MAQRRIKHYVIGIDEVGRGSLAGPVTVAAVILTEKKRFSGLKDSKKLSEKQRNKWFKAIKGDKEIFYAVSSVYPKMIDKINIAEAANFAATKAFFKLVRAPFFLKQPFKVYFRVYLDGGLHLKSRFANFYESKTIVKGDEKINAIKIASIVAKVSRDSYMKRLSRRYPQYGFAVNKGYGTKEHLKAIEKYGPSKVHRLTFIRKCLILK
jgi:ribonuclease HII